MSDESLLFTEFARSRSETAFAGLVKLHVNLVFGTAFRQLGDRALAEEVTQNVFVALAQKAESLDGKRTVAGWLYETTLNQCRQLQRSELRRRKREEIAAACAEIERSGESTRAGLLPLLDEGLVSLNEAERVAVILHFMEAKPFREVGRQLGVGEDAARKRVNRALEWLTDWFRKRGVAVPSGVVVAALSLEGMPTVSAGTITGIVAAGSAAVPAAAVSGLASIVGIVMASKTKILIGGAAIALLITAPIVFRKSERSARVQPAEAEMTAAASETVALRPGDGVSAARLKMATSEPVATAAREKTIFERINEGDESLSMLPREQAEAFLARNKTNAESLLAAYRVTHDVEYLRRAATNFPNDPHVLMRAVSHNAFPEEKRQWLEQFKKADSANALPHYLSAAEHLKAGEMKAAFQDLANGTQRGTFQDHVTEQILTLEEMYLAAGHSSAEAKMLAACAVELPHLTQINDLSRGMVDLVKQYQQAGDNASAENLVAMGVKLSEHIGNLQEGGNVLGQVVAERTKRAFLEQLDPARSYAFLTGGVTEMIDAGRTRENAIRADAQVVNGWIPEATEADIVNYFDRLKLYGETAAIEWLKNRRAAR
jgi:RNA polymerase sigma factor (sigma-70 family)